MRKISSGLCWAPWTDLRTDFPFICLHRLSCLALKPPGDTSWDSADRGKVPHSNLIEGREQMMCTFFQGHMYLFSASRVTRKSWAFYWKWRVSTSPACSELTNTCFDRNRRHCQLCDIYTRLSSLEKWQSLRSGTGETSIISRRYSIQLSDFYILSMNL